MTIPDNGGIPPYEPILDLYITAEQEAAMAAKREIALCLFVECAKEVVMHGADKEEHYLDVAKRCFTAAAAFDQAQMEAER